MSTKVSKQSVHYQPNPHLGRRCRDCTMFEPQASPASGAMGTCTAVTGLISPNGWCELFEALPEES